MSPARRIERMLARRDVRGLGAALLHARNTLIRREAAQALGDLSDPAGVPYLANAMRDSGDDYVRRWAIDSLREIGGRKAVDALAWGMFSLGRQLSRLSEHALTQMESPRAQAALQIKDLLIRQEDGALLEIPPDSRDLLGVILISEQYASWPTARRQQVLKTAVRMGVTPPEDFKDDLADMGLYLSGVHTVNDLRRGLDHRNPSVRIAAADKLAESGQKWTLGVLYRRFEDEVADGNRPVAAALARAMGRMGDSRPVMECHERLLAGGQPATEAAYLLAAMDTDEAARLLFWFAADPPPPPAYRNVPLALTALESMGDEAVERLRVLTVHESAEARRTMVLIIARSPHPDKVPLLGKLARDDDSRVQAAALDALAGEGNETAVEQLESLAEDVPVELISTRLFSIPQRAAVETLKRLVPDVTTVSGQVTRDERQPVEKAGVQVLAGTFDGQEWGWRPASVRVETDEAGRFLLAVREDGEDRRARLKVVLPGPPGGPQPDPYYADFEIVRGQENTITARIDTFFERLVAET